MSEKIQFYQPSGTRILVVRRAPKSETESGVVILQQSQEKHSEGIVVAVGKGRVINGQLVEPDYAVGDEVRFGKYNGEELKLGEREHVLLESEDVQGRVETWDPNVVEDAEKIAAYHTLLEKAGYSLTPDRVEGGKVAEAS